MCGVQTRNAGFAGASSGSKEIEQHHLAFEILELLDPRLQGTSDVKTRRCITFAELRGAGTSKGQGKGRGPCSYLHVEDTKPTCIIA